MDANKTLDIVITKRKLEEHQLAKDMYDLIFARTESFEIGHIGGDLAYLMGAILSDKSCEWNETRLIVQLLRTNLPTFHPVWLYIDIIE